MPTPVVTVTLNPAIDQTLRVPGFAAGRVNRVTETQNHPGGKGVNVAVMLADLGETVAATGWLGSRNAEPFRLLFARKRIDDQFLRVPGETRVGLKISDGLGMTTDVNFPGLPVGPTAEDDLLGRLISLTGPGTWVVLAGSVPPGVDDGIYARLAGAVIGRGGRVVLDTSGPPLDAALATGAEFAKPNLAELADLAGRALTTPRDVVAAARDTLIACGVRLAVVSMGADGAAFVTAGEAWRTRAPAVTVASTVGAGDAMVAGLVHALSRGRPLPEAARLATGLGTYAVTRVRSGLDDPAAYTPLVARVTVEPL